MIDLLTELRAVVFRELTDTIDTTLAAVFDDVPPDTQPNFLKVGLIDSVADRDKGDQIERMTVDVMAIYRGEDRGVMLAMLHAARTALDRKTFVTDAAAFQDMRWIASTASEASHEDGVTYAGVSSFEVWGEPA